MKRASMDPAGQDDPSKGSQGGRIIDLCGLRGKTGTRRRWLVLLGVLLLAGGGWLASLRLPTGAATGAAVQELPAPTNRADNRFRFGTFNIHGCVGSDGRYDESRVAEALADLDLVGLNEVRGWAWGEATNQAAAVGRRLGLGWLSAPAECRWYCQQFGNGLLTRLPVDRWERIPLPGRFAKSPRNLLRSEVRLGDRRVQVLLTHLIRSDEPLRRQQFREVTQRFLSLEGPAVFAGDLNANGSDPLIQELLTQPGVVDALARERPSREAKQIDWVFVRGLEVRAAGVREGPASDHPLVWADLALPSSGE